MPIPTQPAPRLAVSGLPKKEVLAQVRDELAEAPLRAGLIDPELEPPDGGAAGTLAQTRQSFALLRFCQGNPALLSLFPDLRPEDHRYLVGVRLHAAQARAVMERVQEGLEAAELLLLGQITEDNDRLEDHFTARWSDAGASPGERLRLSSYRDVAQLRRLQEGSQEQKQRRRQARRLQRAGARSEAERLRTRPRGAERLRRLEP